MPPLNCWRFVAASTNRSLLRRGTGSLLALLFASILLTSCRTARPTYGLYDPAWSVDSAPVAADLSAPVARDARRVVVERTDHGRFYDVRDLILPIPNFEGPRLELSTGEREFDRFDDFDEEAQPNYDPDFLVDMIQAQVGPDREVRLVGNGHIWVGPEGGDSDQTR
ncbi:MAG: hypothetical protein AAF196_16525 [Planctomycetota bacterium]